MKPVLGASGAVHRPTSSRRDAAASEERHPGAPAPIGPHFFYRTQFQPVTETATDLVHI